MASPSSTAQPPPTAAGDRVASSDLNMDDIKETFRQVFQGQAPEPSQRAEPGTDGVPCKVLVNMYPVTLPKGLVYHYDVEIYSAPRKSGGEVQTPVPAQKRARCASTLVNREVIDAFSKCYQNELGNCFLAFDGRRNLYTRRQLPFSVSAQLFLENSLEFIPQNVPKPMRAAITEFFILCYFRNISSTMSRQR